MRFVRLVLRCCAASVCWYAAATADPAYAFEEKDCSRIESVKQSYNIDLKSSDSVEAARARAVTEMIKQAILQAVGVHVRSSREEDTQVLNNDAQEKYRDAERALLEGNARVRIVDEKRTALPSGQNLSLIAEVSVCIPKPEALIKAEREKEERLTHPPKPVDPSNAVWFNPASGEPQIWYSRGDAGAYSFFDNPGFDPITGEALKSASSKTIREWKLFVARRQREEAAEANRAQLAMEEKRLAAERARLAREKRADLLLHARENCDKLAANPNDSDKPPAVVGATYDELKAANADAIQACEAAVETEPNDRRLKYQLARAYSIEDPRRAAPMFKALCAQHYLAAYDNYGWTFLSRKAGPPNLEAAIAFFKRGAQLGDSDAMVSLATYIQKGKVPGSSLNDAVALYRKASSLGNQDAAKALEPVLEAQKQAETQQQQAAVQQQRDLQNAQAIMGLFGAAMGGMSR